MYLHNLATGVSVRASSRQAGLLYVDAGLCILIIPGSVMEPGGALGADACGARPQARSGLARIVHRTRGLGMTARVVGPGQGCYVGGSYCSPCPVMIVEGPEGQAEARWSCGSTFACANMRLHACLGIISIVMLH